MCALPSHSPAGELYSFVIFAPALQEYFHDGKEGVEKGGLCGKKGKESRFWKIFRHHLASWQGCWIPLKNCLTNKI